MGNYEMVPGSGPESNPKNHLLEEWEKNSKGLLSDAYNLPGSSNIDQLFDTLAEWNEYLENHVPYFSERSVIEEREP